jgi:hypothetical protein
MCELKVVSHVEGGLADVTFPMLAQSRRAA